MKEVKTQIAALPWSGSSLPIIKFFAPSPEILNGFTRIKEFEDEDEVDIPMRRKIQLEHLLEIAKHEQGVILQPLIYDDPAFSGWVKQQRAWYAQWASPTLELVFTHQCSNKNLEVVSVAPKETRLENFLSRMEWINAAALKFHSLMHTKKNLHAFRTFEHCELG